MSISEARLSARRLGEAVAIVTQDKTFTFVVGKNQTKYTCSLLQACFVSGKVANLVSSDPTIDTLQLLPDEDNINFGLVEQLWNGNSITVDDSSRNHLFNLSLALENDELGSIVRLSFSSDDISIENCVDRLRLKKRMDADRSDEIKFIASRITEIDFSLLTVDELELVLTSDSLKVDCENSLLDKICTLSSQDESYRTLFKYVKFEYLDLEHLDLFFERVYPELIDGVLWESITKFIKASVLLQPKSRRPKVNTNTKTTTSTTSTSGGQVFEYNSAYPLRGIFDNLRSTCGGNPHNRGIIELKSSGSRHQATHPLHGILDYDNHVFFLTTNDQPSWVELDMKRRKVRLTHYTLKGWPGAGDYLKHWVLEASNDEINWSILDEKIDSSELCQKSAISTFQVAESNEFYRYFRLRHTGVTSSSNTYLAFSCIELFGEVITEPGEDPAPAPQTTTIPSTRQNPWGGFNFGFSSPK